MMEEREAQCMENRRLGIEERKYREAVLREKNELEKLRRENREFDSDFDEVLDEPPIPKITTTPMVSTRLRGITYWKNKTWEQYIPPVSLRILKPSPTPQLLAKRPRSSCVACSIDQECPKSVSLPSISDDGTKPLSLINSSLSDLSSDKESTGNDRKESSGRRESISSDRRESTGSDRKQSIGSSRKGSTGSTGNDRKER